MDDRVFFALFQPLLGGGLPPEGESFHRAWGLSCDDPSISVPTIKIASMAALISSRRPGFTMPCVVLALAGGIGSILPVFARSQETVTTPNYVIGTQAIGGTYQFTDEPALAETAKVVQEMGASNFKFALRLPKGDPEIRSVADLVRKDPSHLLVLGMPFRDFLMWVDAREEGAWAKGLDPVQAVREYRQMYELTAHLLSAYNGSGKRFYLGHWEGDNMLRPGGAEDPQPRRDPGRPRVGLSLHPLLAALQQRTGCRRNPPRFWMIDDEGVKQPVYEVHRSFYEWARQWHSANAPGSGMVGEAFRNGAIDRVRAMEAGTGR